MEGDFMAANVGAHGNSTASSTSDSTYTDPELDELTEREREVHQPADGENACGTYSGEDQCT